MEITDSATENIPPLKKVRVKRWEAFAFNVRAHRISGDTYSSVNPTGSKSKYSCEQGCSPMQLGRTLERFRKASSR